MLKFCPEDDFLVNRYNFSFAGKGYGYREPFDKTSVSIRKLRQLFDARLIVPVEQPLTKEDVSATFEIRQAGPAWLKVYKDGEQIGKAVRTREEAQAIVDENS